jgi:chorismate-pyruvate lyase
LQRNIVQDAEPGRGRPSAPAQLDAFLTRAILATDGTVTNLIEEFCEPVGIEKLDERQLDGPVGDAWPDLDPGVHVVSREVVIRGRTSGRIYLHAESLVVLDHLDDILRRELLETDKPIGKLIREYRRETFRELLGHHVEPAGELAVHFECEPAAPLVTRIYRIHLGGRPAIQITERLPDYPAIGAPGPTGEID